MFDTLVDVDTLRKHLEYPSWVVVDCRHSLTNPTAGRAQYEARHIPGAAFADTERDLSGAKSGTNGRHPLPTPESLAEFLGGIGVGDRSQLVAYDEGAGMFAARLWMLARSIGHASVAVLDGGFAAWIASGAPTGSGPARRSHLKTSLSLRPPLDCVLSAAEMLDAVQRRTRQPLDARAPERYRGEIEPIDPVAGHIPGAKNRPFALNYRADGHFRSPEELRAQFAAYGSDERLVHYCGSGISASVNLLAAHLAGVPDGCIYAGSWSEWCANDSRPIERG